MPVGPTDKAGLALSSLSLLGQLFGGSVRVLKGYHKADNLSADALELQINLEWARSRLEAWGTEWGVDKGMHLKNERFRKYGLVAMNHLVYINHLLLELSKTETGYTTMGEAAKFASSPVVSLARLTKEGGVSDMELEALRDKIEQLEVDASFQEKVRWTLEDKGALKKVHTVKQMIEDLFLQFPPPEEDSAGTLATNKDLGSSDENKLDLIIKSATSDPVLASLTLLKVERLKLEGKAENLRSTDPDVDVVCLRKDEGTGPRRIGEFFDEKKLKYTIPVLIEEKEVPNGSDFDSQHQRINNVARLLAMDNKPSEMRTLYCLGVLSLSHRTTTTHKLLYKLPAPRYFTLKDILSHSRHTLPLGMKFTCAKILARAVLYLHLASWLHKGIRSDNIIFCADTEDQVDFAEPYICGFEYSRHSASVQDSEDVDGDALNNLYRHPEAQGLPLFRREYKAAYVYALGIVLLELGHHRSLGGLKGKYEEETGQEWTAGSFGTWIVQKVIPAMVPKMGEIYANVIRTCLEGLKVEEGRTPEENLFLKVVREIDQCRA